MDARPLRTARFAVILVSVTLSPFATVNAQHLSARTQNFIVTAPTKAFAAQVAKEAERLRRSLAQSWLGKELPPWEDPVPINVLFRRGAGGVTSFEFHGRVPREWEMEVRGSKERILDSVLPHEITHTVFATHFGRPLPRWADEGACTTVEHHSERRKQDRILVYYLTHEKGIPFNKMFPMMSYPGEILTIYSQGYSVSRYLIAQGGRQEFVRFIKTGLDTRNWNEAVRRHYSYKNLSDLQVKWNAWVQDGSPKVSRALADNKRTSSAPAASAQATTTEAPRGLPAAVTSPAPSAPSAPVAPRSSSYAAVARQAAKGGPQQEYQAPRNGRDWASRGESNLPRGESNVPRVEGNAPRGESNVPRDEYRAPKRAPLVAVNDSPSNVPSGGPKRELASRPDGAFSTLPREPGSAGSNRPGNEATPPDPADRSRPLYRPGSISTVWR